MYGCMYAYMSVRRNGRIDECISVCIHGCMYAWMYECIYVCVYVCSYVSVYVWMDVWMYVCFHACMYKCMYVCQKVWKRWSHVWSRISVVEEPCGINTVSTLYKIVCCKINLMNSLAKLLRRAKRSKPEGELKNRVEEPKRAPAVVCGPVLKGSFPVRDSNAWPLVFTHRVQQFLTLRVSPPAY